MKHDARDLPPRAKAAIGSRATLAIGHWATKREAASARPVTASASIRCGTNSRRPASPMRASALSASDAAMKSGRRDTVAEMIAHETATRTLRPIQRTGYTAATHWHWLC